ncbi:hypothetical protein WA158_005830 [Blastocystis sp. Blastoise]
MVQNNGDVFLHINATADGISVFTNPVADKNKSAYPILINLLNYKRNRIYDRREFWHYSTTNSDNVDTMFYCLRKELQKLCDGILLPVFINNKLEMKKVVCVLSGVYGDTAEITKLASLSGPSSNYPCRYCIVNVNRDTESFHKGIKCSRKYLKNHVVTEKKGHKHIHIYYPFNSKFYYSKKEAIIKKDDEKLLDYAVFKSSEVFKDSLEEITCDLRSKNHFLSIRNNSEGENREGVKNEMSQFEHLSYFDPSSSFALDCMHLFNNVCSKLLSLFFDYNHDETIKTLTKYYINDADKLIDKLKLDVENMNILKARLESINTLYGNYEYQFRYVLDEKKFFKVSSHTRVFFTSKILPLIISDFSISDSCLVPILDCLSDLINECTYTDNSYSWQHIEILKQKCYTFTFLCELVLPNVLLDSQIHGCQHLYKSICESGSLALSSTWKSEQYYGVIKRSTYGRNNFNESSMIYAIKKEIELTSSDVLYNNIDENSLISSFDNSNIYSNVFEDNSEKSYQYQYKLIKFPDVINGISCIKGIRGMDDIILDDSDYRKLSKIIVESNMSHLSSVIFSGIDVLDKSDNDIISLIDVPSYYTCMKKNFKKLRSFYYSEVLVNNNIIFTTSTLDEGIERIDNSYLIMLVYTNRNRILCVLS